MSRVHPFLPKAKLLVYKGIHFQIRGWRVSFWGTVLVFHESLWRVLALYIRSPLGSGCPHHLSFHGFIHRQGVGGVALRCGSRISVVPLRVDWLMH